MFRHWSQWLWICWTIVILFLSLTPGDHFPTIEWELISPSTLAHVIMYSGLSFLMLVGWDKTKMNLSAFQLYSTTITVGILLGTTIEWIQGEYIEKRYFESGDILSNLIGTFFGSIFYYWIGVKIVKIVRPNH